ncbi:MAG: DUF2490 domain-containing protein [Flavobacteriales bacterium]|nr:DUF2490 domain-containing protein [Flavobacteriales bacterium]
MSRYHIAFNPVCLVMVTCTATAQYDTHHGELWAGYIGTIRVAEKWSVWQDYHGVPEAFAVARYGVVWKPTAHWQAVGGFGWVWTSTSFTSELVRGEYRPWGQVLGQTRLGERWAGQLRFRYDARFRQRLGDGVVLDDHGFNHRLRLMARVRRDLRTMANGDVLHLNLMDELLYNTGREVRDGVDQNRLYLLMGFTHKRYTLLGGYHVRMIPQTAGGMRYNHGITLWLLHTIDVRHRFKRPDEEKPPPLPHGG